MNLQEPLWLDIEATQIHLGHTVILGLLSRGNLTPIFLVTAPIYIPHQKRIWLPFSHILLDICCHCDSDDCHSGWNEIAFQSSFNFHFSDSLRYRTLSWVFICCLYFFFGVLSPKPISPFTDLDLGGRVNVCAS